MAFAGAAGAQDLTLRMPAEMVAKGLDKQLLPRFKFKHRVSVEAVTDGNADMVLGPGAAGTRVFEDAEGNAWRLEILAGDDAADRAELFAAWLKSTPGKAAIESFAPNGRQLFTTEVAVVVEEAPEVFDGDRATGSRLALVHCGRCHVVDKRNRMGGIGSTPSFAALRGRDNWPDLFRAFYVHNPHPSFTQVEDVTEPFDPNRQIHVAPVEVTLDEIEAITAFVATLTPKDLGRPVQSK
ncbi:MAG: hypothetical protein HKM96_12015 [Boseongicola sp.]|nr:hypothetical protein [Silicimonas sp.]NND21827.1 hypothetical protein [Silicimonas sp.]NNF92107.1 hypothetical protein [Boseongicola sp.]NNL36241.1 hypothetical protein [Silicimonas sp.]